MKPGRDLAALLCPMSPDDFLRDYWTQKSVVVHGPLSRLAGFDSIAAFQDVNQLVHLEVDRMRVWVFENDEKSFENAQCVVSPEVGAFLFNNRKLSTLVLSTVRGIPALDELFTNLHGDLYLSS